MNNFLTAFCLSFVFSWVIENGLTGLLVKNTYGSIDKRIIQKCTWIHVTSYTHCNGLKQDMDSEFYSLYTTQFNLREKSEIFYFQNSSLEVFSWLPFRIYLE